MIETCFLQAKSEEQMRKSGNSLATSMYRLPCTILLRGELGAGKTTFVQGFAGGLGLTEAVTSPTYALEQRYGDGALSHIDLYRLNPVQAAEFMRTLDPFPGIRVIEWSNRTSGIEADIEIDITETSSGRSIAVTFGDVSIPSDDKILEWMDQVELPEHIRRHVRKVAEISDMVADHLMHQGRIVRKKALHSAALTHDLLRYVDFTSLEGDTFFTPSKKQTAVWIHNKEMFGTPHEFAAEKFLIKHGYPEIGLIVRSHRGYGQRESIPTTIEQCALSYADKRAIIDRFVTLDERFDDFSVRYGKGGESAIAGEWRTSMKQIETSLFQEGAPF